METMMKMFRIAPVIALTLCTLAHFGIQTVIAGGEKPLNDADSTPKSVEVVISQEAMDANGLERFAATELERYLQRLFGVSTHIVTSPTDSADGYFLLGASGRLPGQNVDAGLLPTLSDQGFLLRKIEFRKKPAMVILGGSPRAMMWGVYEFAERYGVHYLLGGDVYPEHSQPFHLTEIYQTFEPTFKMRWFKTMGDFAMGMEGWGMADYRPFLDQLAKLKFNRIRIGGCPTAPFLDLQLKGVKRQSAFLWYNEHYPYTPDMPGYRIFSKETGKEFWNPDLLTPDAPYEKLAAAGERHMHELIAYAHSRGIEASSVWSIADFPKDLASAVPGAQEVQQLGMLTVSPGPTVRPDDPAVTEIGATLLRTILDTYPDCDSYGFAVGTESPSWVGLYEWAWKELDKQYGIEKVISLEEVMRRASQRTDHWDGGAARTVREVKGHITGLYYLLRLWNDPNVLPKTRRPDAKLIVYEVAEELWPILPRILPKNSEQSIVMDYNPTRVLRRRNVLATAPAKEVPTTMVLTLHDDSVGTLPLLTATALHELVGDMRKAGITGFGTRQWLISDHDWSTSYLSKAAWNPDITPKAVWDDLIQTLCGQAAVEPMWEMAQQVEAVTTRLEDHGMGITFPQTGMLLSYWSPDALQPPFLEDQAIYARALDAVRKVPTPTRPEGKAYVEYWTGRLLFATGYFDALRAVQKAAIAEKEAKEAQQKGDTAAYRAKLAEAIEHAKVGHAAAFQAIDAYANVAKNRADLGAIAMMAENVCRKMDRKIEELRAEHDKAH
jgi:hypothetical protein